MDWRFDGLTALVSIAAGKAADLVVLAGNRAKNIDDVEERWFSAAESLPTLRGLADWVRSIPLGCLISRDKLPILCQVDNHKTPIDYF